MNRLNSEKIKIFIPKPKQPFSGKMLTSEFPDFNGSTLYMRDLRTKAGRFWCRGRGAVRRTVARRTIKILNS